MHNITCDIWKHSHSIDLYLAQYDYSISKYASLSQFG